MRTLTTGGVTLTYPDLWAFCFSPCYVEITGATGYAKAIVSVYNGNGAYNVETALYGGKAKILISSYLQLLASAGLSGNRCVDAAFYVSLNDGTDTTKVFDEQATGGFFIMWGALRPVQRIGFVGAYTYDPVALAFVRRVRWFKNFPFRVSIFGAANTPFRVRYDRNLYGTTHSFGGCNGYLDIDPNTYASAAQRMAVIRTEGAGNGGGTFDDTFDYTFEALASDNTITRLIVDNACKGYYLRWIDYLGQLQYYLFDEGTRATKTENGDTIETPIVYGGVNYGGGRRVTSKECQRSAHVAAVGLNQDECDYVSTIAQAVIIDLYRGKDADDNEIWLPVTIEAGQFSASERVGLQDYEITINLPTEASQRL